MRIWAQTGSALGKEPDQWGSVYEQSLKRRVQEVARPGTVVDVYGLEKTLPGLDGYFSSRNIYIYWCIKNAIQAERKGYDAWVTVCTLDSGFHEVREVVDIPVVFPMETSLHLACLLAPKFAFLTHNELLLLRLTEMAKRYGLAERMVPGGCLSFSLTDLQDMYKNPKPYIDAVTEEAKKVVERGANIFLPSANTLNLFMVDQGIREIDEVPILDVCGAVVKAAELMVDLKEMGITRSKKGLYSAPSKDELAEVRKLFQ